MRLQVKRDLLTQRTSCGVLSIDGEFFCHTLEDTDRKLESGGRKIPERTAIPRGAYPLKITFSNRFQKYLPELMNVPQFTGVRIHAGNTENDTEGCILVGHRVDELQISNSRVTFNELFDILDKADKAGEKMEIEIS